MTECERERVRGRCERLPKHAKISEADHFATKCSFSSSKKISYQNKNAISLQSPASTKQLKFYFYFSFFSAVACWWVWSTWEGFFLVKCRNENLIEIFLINYHLTLCTEIVVKLQQLKLWHKFVRYRFWWQSFCSAEILLILNQITSALERGICAMLMYW